ncbi:hypothetical protein G7Z17_g1493 [Cylindrodendrum hubeiense]|uniref:Secreted protein n=1 Tax=Cylindrodendrum hubeiense TaxID=595255 RepID=A0A9P5LLB4_9HYPO|nr:hypothetical protein G7Z17_g1493 [Cylindrodendrum hubeiense]
MLIQAPTLFAIAAFFASGVIGNPIKNGVESGNGIVAAREISIATSPDYACRCPNNCDYNDGHSCKFYDGTSDSDPIASGRCHYNKDHELTCMK